MVKQLIDVDRLTRLTLVDETGRIYERRDINIVFDVQDQGMTLKVFVEGRGHDHQKNEK